MVTGVNNIYKDIYKTNLEGFSSSVMKQITVKW